MRAFGAPAASTNGQDGNAVKNPAGYVDRAEQAFREGDDARAAEICRQGVAAFPEDQRLRLTFAKVLSALRKHDEAYPQMEAALAIGPAQDAALHAMAGTIASASGRHGRAAEHYSEAQRLEPLNPRHPLYLAMAQIRLEQDTAAMATLLRVIKLDESIAEAWGTLAELNLKVGNPGPAILQARRARELQPTVVRWRVREATAHKRENQPEKALALLTALPPTDRKDDDVLRVIAECCGILNNPGLAAAEYARAADATKRREQAAERHYQAGLWFGRAGNNEYSALQMRAAADLGHAAAARLVDALPDGSGR